MSPFTSPHEYDTLSLGFSMFSWRDRSVARPIEEERSARSPDGDGAPRERFLRPSPHRLRRVAQLRHAGYTRVDFGAGGCSPTELSTGNTFGGTRSGRTESHGERCLFSDVVSFVFDEIEDGCASQRRSMYEHCQRIQPGTASLEDAGAACRDGDLCRITVPYREREWTRFHGQENAHQRGGRRRVSHCHRRERSSRILRSCPETESPIQGQCLQGPGGAN